MQPIDAFTTFTVININYGTSRTLTFRIHILLSDDL